MGYIRYILLYIWVSVDDIRVGYIHHRGRGGRRRYSRFINHNSYIDYPTRQTPPRTSTLSLLTLPFRLPKPGPRTRLPYQQRLMLDPIPTIRSHVHDHFVHLLPSVFQIQGKSCGRRLDVCFGSGCVCGFEAGLEEHGAEAEAVVVGVYGEDVEDWDGVGG